MTSPHPATSPDAAGGGRTPRALIVDDTPDIRFMVGFQLKSEGISCEEAGSGQQALDRCASEVFDVIVLDFRMPGLSGIDVAQRLRGDRYPTPIVIYSAFVDDELKATAQALEIPVVDKSDNERLLETVRTAVAMVTA